MTSSPPPASLPPAPAIDEIDVGEIERAAHHATGGPWDWDCDGGDAPATVYRGTGAPIEVARCEASEDATYLSLLSPDVVLALVARLRQAEAEREEIARTAQDALASRCSRHIARAESTCEVCDRELAARLATP